MKIVILDSKTLGSDLDLTPLNAFGEVITYLTTTSKETEKYGNFTKALN